MLRPEDFGARGDGAANDTAAFARLSAEVNRRGGGTIALGARRTYVVGSQTRGGSGLAWSPDPILELQGLSSPLTILGNGARLRAQPGLRFGTFEPETDRPIEKPMPNYDYSSVAGAYRAMISVSKSRAPVAIRNLELDGNVAKLRLGGPFGDTGWQVPATGLLLTDNHAAELVENVFSHHHGQDGGIIIGDDNRSARSRFSRYVARFNGRQGLSITGGRAYDFVDCEFSHTGRSAIRSAPGAGVDIEAEGAKIIRDLSFTRCRFVDNHGCGLVADSGDSEGARFTDCTFIGTSLWSAWPRKPRFSFTGCTFVGSVVHAFADPSPARAARFTHCRFTDDPKLSPTGKVYASGPIVNLGESDHVLFDGCTVDCIAGGVLPWSSTAIYRDCTMRQHSRTTAYPRGRYLGRTRIDAPVNLYGSMIQGVVIVNGRELKRGPIDVDPW